MPAVCSGVRAQHRARRRTRRRREPRLVRRGPIRRSRDGSCASGLGTGGDQSQLSERAPVPSLARLRSEPARCLHLGAFVSAGAEGNVARRRCDDRRRDTCGRFPDPNEGVVDYGRATILTRRCSRVGERVARLPEPLHRAPLVIRASPTLDSANDSARPSPPDGRRRHRRRSDRPARIRSRPRPPSPAVGEMQQALSQQRAACTPERDSRRAHESVRTP